MSKPRRPGDFSDLVPKLTDEEWAQVGNDLEEPDIHDEETLAKISNILTANEDLCVSIEVDDKKKRCSILACEPHYSFWQSFLGKQGYIYSAKKNAYLYYNPKTNLEGDWWFMLRRDA
jgi:hypothetical protein